MRKTTPFSFIFRTHFSSLLPFNKDILRAVVHLEENLINVVSTQSPLKSVNIDR